MHMQYMTAMPTFKGDLHTVFLSLIENFVIVYYIIRE